MQAGHPRSCADIAERLREKFGWSGSWAASAFPRNARRGHEPWRRPSLAASKPASQPGDHEPSRTHDARRDRQDARRYIVRFHGQRELGALGLRRALVTTKRLCSEVASLVLVCKTDD